VLEKWLRQPTFCIPSLLMLVMMFRLLLFLSHRSLLSFFLSFFLSLLYIFLSFKHSLRETQPNRFTNGAHLFYLIVTLHTNCAVAMYAQQAKQRC